MLKDDGFKAVGADFDGAAAAILAMDFNRRRGARRFARVIRNAQTAFAQKNSCPLLFASQGFKRMILPWRLPGLSMREASTTMTRQGLPTCVAAMADAARMLVHRFHHIVDKRFEGRMASASTK